MTRAPPSALLLLLFPKVGEKGQKEWSAYTYLLRFLTQMSRIVCVKLKDVVATQCCVWLG